MVVDRDCMLLTVLRCAFSDMALVLMVIPMVEAPEKDVNRQPRHDRLSAITDAV